MKPAIQIAYFSLSHAGRGSLILGGALMRTWRIQPVGRPAVVGVLAIAIVIAGCVTNDAGARKAALAKAAAAQQEKPVKLRYYGGPKSPMYPE
jgi:hypothetical protein